MRILAAGINMMTEHKKRLQSAALDLTIKYPLSRLGFGIFVSLFQSDCQT